MIALASLKAKLHVSVADGEPVELCAFEIPLQVTGVGHGLDNVKVGSTNLSNDLADVLEEAARQLRSR